MPESDPPLETLVRACVERGSEGDWEAFVRRTRRLVGGVALRTARQCGELGPDLLDDLVQETYLRLCAEECRLLRIFDGRHEGALAGYLKAITSSVVRDYFRRRRSLKRGAGERHEALDETRGGVRDDSVELERRILLSQIEKCVLRCAPGQNERRNRSIFWLYYQQGWSARAIAALPAIDLTPKGVESAIQRLTRQVKDELGEP